MLVKLIYVPFVSIIFLTVLKYSLCQSKCCGPNQWNGGIVQKIGRYNRPDDAATLAETTTQFYYDYDLKKIAYTQPLHNLTYNRTDMIHVIQDYSKAKEWVINGTNCKLRDLSGDMPSPCVSDSATHVGQYISTGPKVDVWLLHENGNIIRSTVTSDTCIPVMESLLTGGPVYTLRVSVYENVTQGIPDRTVFKIPTFCPQRVLDSYSRPVESQLSETLYFRGGRL